MHFVVEVHYKETSLISNVHQISSIVCFLHSFILHQYHRIAKRPIVQFQYIFQYSHVVHQYIYQIRGQNMEYRCNTAIICLQLFGGIIIHSKMVLECFHIRILKSLLRWFLRQQHHVVVFYSMCVDPIVENSHFYHDMKQWYAWIYLMLFLLFPTHA